MVLSHIQVSWNRKDIITYALGVGAKHDELSLVYGKEFRITVRLVHTNLTVVELGSAFLTSLRSAIDGFHRQVMGTATDIPGGACTER